MEQEKKRKVLTSEYLFRRPWLTVRRESLELASGKLVPEYYVLEYPAWVNTIAITRGGEFLMIRQYRHGLGATHYELCAGVCEPDDVSFLAAAQRELLEETGYGRGQWREQMVISANPSTQTNLTHCFVATDVEFVSAPALDPTEELTVHLLTLDEVRELLCADQIKQALHAASLWRYFGENHLL